MGCLARATPHTSFCSTTTSSSFCSSATRGWARAACFCASRYVCGECREPLPFDPIFSSVPLRGVAASRSARAHRPRRSRHHGPVRHGKHTRCELCHAHGFVGTAGSTVSACAPAGDVRMRVWGGLAPSRGARGWTACVFFHVLIGVAGRHVHRVVHQHHRSGLCTSGASGSHPRSQLPPRRKSAPLSWRARPSSCRSGMYAQAGCWWWWWLQRI